jgi:glyoxylase I family protein
MSNDAPVTPTRIHHVRLTVTDIARSKAFYSSLFGADPVMDFSGEGPSDDPQRLYGGCIFQIGDQIMGLRPVAATGDVFDSTRVGLDHVSFGVGSTDELTAAATRLDELGVEHGEVTDLGGMGVSILSLQDPDDINLELTAPH